MFAPSFIVIKRATYKANKNSNIIKKQKGGKAFFVFKQSDLDMGT